MYLQVVSPLYFCSRLPAKAKTINGYPEGAFNMCSLLASMNNRLQRFPLAATMRVRPDEASKPNPPTT